MQKQVSAIITMKDRFSGPLIQMSKNIEGLDKETRDSMNTVNRWSNKVVKGVDKAVKATAKWAKRGAILGAGWSVKSGLEGASELDYASRKVKSIAGDRLDMDGIRKDIKEFSFEFGKAYEEVGQGMYNAISSSIPMDLLNEAVVLGNQLSVAGFTGMDESIDLMSTTMNAFDIKTSEGMKDMADQFLTTQNLGKIEVGEMAQHYGRISTLSSQIGASLNEQNAAMATMTKRGLSPTEAVTGYRSILNAFLKNTTDTQAAALEQLGLGGDFLTAKTFKELGFSGVMDKVAKAAGGDLDLVSEIFSDLRGKAGAIMFDPEFGMEDYHRILEQINTQEDPLKDAHDTMNQSITRQWSIFKQRIKTLNDELYTEEEGVGGYLVKELRDANDWLDENREDIIKKVNETSEAVIEGAKTMGEFAVEHESPLKKFGKALLGMYGFTKVTGWIGSFADAFGKVKKVIGKLFTGELFVGGGITGFIAKFVGPLILAAKDVGVAITTKVLIPLAKAAAPVLKTIAIVIAAIVGVVWVLIVALRALSAWEEGGWRAGLQSIKDDWGSTTGFIGDKWDGLKEKFSGGLEFGGFKAGQSGMTERVPAIEKVRQRLIDNPFTTNLEISLDPQGKYDGLLDLYNNNPIKSKVLLETDDFKYGALKVEEEYGMMRTFFKDNEVLGKIGLDMGDFQERTTQGQVSLGEMKQYFSDNPIVGLVPTMDLTDFDKSSEEAGGKLRDLSGLFRKNPVKADIMIRTDVFQEESSYVKSSYELLDMFLKGDTPTGNTMLLKEEFQNNVVEVGGNYGGLVGSLASKDAVGEVGINGYTTFMNQISNMNRSWNSFNNNVGSRPVGPPNRPANYIQGKYKGTPSWKGGPVQVHERGGEIMDVPGGTRIYPHDESVRMAREDGASAVLAGAGGQSINVSLGGVNFLGDFNTKADINEIGTKIVERIKTELKNI